MVHGVKNGRDVWHLEKIWTENHMAAIKEQKNNGDKGRVSDYIP